MAARTKNDSEGTIDPIYGEEGCWLDNLFCRGYKDLISKLVYLNKVPKNTIVKRDDSSLIIRCKKTVQDIKPCISRSAEHIFLLLLRLFTLKVLESGDSNCFLGF